MAKKFDGEIITEVQTVTLGTLADQASIKFSALVLQEDFRILKSEIAAFIADIDDSSPTQGLLFGICNGELTAAEIAQAITTGGPLDRNDRLAKERSSRWVKVLSQAEPVPDGSNGAQTTIQLIFRGDHGGPMIVSKDRWTYSDPEGWAFFIHNNTGAVLVSGAQARLTAKHFGVWVT